MRTRERERDGRISSNRTTNEEKEEEKQPRDDRESTEPES
jgi:hypothetical protein